MHRYLLPLLLLSACANPASDAPESDAYVVVIGVDGMSPDGIRNAETPHLDALMAGGAYSFRARAVLPTSSSPNWGSMIHGAGPEQHGITSNDWELVNFEIAPTATGVGPIFPSIFDVLAEQRPEAASASIYDWGGFGRLYNKEAVTVDINADGPQVAAREAVRVFAEQKPVCTFVHLDHVDHAGHADGHGSASYYASVEEADRYIGEILAGLEAAGMRERTTVIVTADHGGVGTGHGGESMAEVEIPWIVHGPGVAAGTVIDDPINTYDTAATAAYVLGLEPPYAWVARPVYAAFEGATRPEPETPGVEGVAHVVVIGVDGMSPDGIQKAATPVLNRIIREGAAGFHARAVMTSSSSQNWASMIMGAGPEQHGITSNGWERDTFSIPPTAAGPEGLFPTMFSEIRAARPDAYIASIYDWGGFGRLFQKNVVDADVDADGPQAAVDAARAQFLDHRPLLTFIHLDHVDHAGHAYGHGTDEYYASVEEADRYIGEILTGLEEAGMADETLVIISADHGGKGTGHGGESMGEMEIPWIAMGPGVPAGARLTAPIDTYDTAATALFALGIPAPYAWIARPVRSAFTAFRDAGAAAEVYVPEPRVQPAGGLFVGEQPVVTLTVDDAEAEVRYTIDGSEPTLSSTLYGGSFEVTETARVRARAFRDGGASSTSGEQYRLLQEGAEYGVSYAYYEASEGEEWKVLPDFDALTPVRSGRAYEFDIERVEGRRADQYAIRFEGTIDIPTDGAYTFTTASDDGSRLYIDGEELVDNDGSHGVQSRNGTVDLTAGPHAIVVTYFEDYAGEHLDVLYQGPGIEQQIIPVDVLHPAQP